MINFIMKLLFIPNWNGHLFLQEYEDKSISKLFELTKYDNKKLVKIEKNNIENTNKIIAVGRQSIGLRSDFTLKTELREFQAEHDTESKTFTVRVRINAKLVQQPNRVIVGSQSFEHTVEIKDDRGMNNIVIAFDQAANRVLKKLVEWTLLKMN